MNPETSRRHFNHDELPFEAIVDGVLCRLVNGKYQPYSIEALKIKLEHFNYAIQQKLSAELINKGYQLQ